MTTKHPSYGYLTKEEFERLSNSPLHAFREQEKERVKEEVKARKEKTPRKKRPKTMFMFEGDKPCAE